MGSRPSSRSYPSPLPTTHSDFLPAYQSWEKTDPRDLFFAAETRKTEANSKGRVCRHLQTEAAGCTYIILWLDKSAPVSAC